MQPKKITVLKIEPQTHVRSTKGDRWLFAVSEEYLQEFDKKQAIDHPQGKPGRNMNRRRQLEKYNAYKEELRWIAKQQDFVMPAGHFAIWFKIPVMKSWRPKKAAEMLYKPHQNTPDCDNMIKAFLDGICPRKKRTKGEKGTDDRHVHCYAAFKIWVPKEESCIVIVEYDEKDFTLAFSEKK